jgi:hypothetical protein
MLCDSCDRAFHTYCVGLGDDVPEGDWFCPDCDLTGSFEVPAIPGLLPVPRLFPQEHLHQTSRGMAISVTHRRPRTRATINHNMRSTARRHRGLHPSATIPQRRPAITSTCITDSNDMSSVGDDGPLQAQIQREEQNQPSGAQEAVAEQRTCWADIQAGWRDFPALAVRSSVCTSAPGALSQCAGSDGHSISEPSMRRRQLRPRERRHLSAANASISHDGALYNPTDAAQADALAIARSILSCEDLAPPARDQSGSSSGALRAWASRRVVREGSQTGTKAFHRLINLCPACCQPYPTFAPGSCSALPTLCHEMNNLQLSSAQTSVAFLFFSFRSNQNCVYPGD